MSHVSARLIDDEQRCYDALLSRDRRFDGQFIAGITSTGIYCRPSCPAPVRPLRKNVRFFPTAAAAQISGMRSCKRCQPDASPGTPEWDLNGDLVARAMRLIERGEVDRIGVAGIARTLNVSERHLHRMLSSAVGASPIALARAQRANLARVLLQTSELSITDVAFASGFSSIRQFNDTIRAIYDRTPSEVRKQQRHQRDGSGNSTGSGGVDLTMWLPGRWPIDLDAMFLFHRSHGIPGVTATSDFDESGPTSYTRNISLDHGTGTMTLWAEGEVDPERPGIWASFELDNIADLASAIAKARAMFDLDADPQQIISHLRNDRLLAPLLRARPGVGVPGTADGFEAAVSAVIGQQISVAGARTILGRLVESRSPSKQGRTTFPGPAEVAQLDLDSIGLTTRRAATVRALSSAVASGELTIDVGQDRAEVRKALLALPGIGPWTADVISMRVLRDPDVIASSDLVIRRRLEELDVVDTSAWAPWRSYVACTLWATRDLDLSTATETTEQDLS